MNNEDRLIYRRKKYYTLPIVLLPIIAQYTIAGVSISLVFLVVATILICLDKKGKISIENNLQPYFVFVLIVTLISSIFVITSPASIILKIVKFILIIFVYYVANKDYFDFDYAFNIYTFVAITASIITIIQFLVYTFSGKALVFIIPNMKLDYLYGLSSNELIESIKATAAIGAFRPSSLFLEPAHQSEYLITWLCISLFLKNKGITIKGLFICIFVTIAICLSGSMAGLLLCMVLWMIYIISLMRLGNTKAKICFIILLPLMLYFVTYIFSSESVANNVAYKLSSISKLEKRSSATLRLLRGWYCFDELPLLQKIIGCGYNNYAYFYRHLDIATIYDSAETTVISFMSGIFTMFCNLGVIGTSLYMFWFFGKFKRVIPKVKWIMLLILILIMFESQFFDTLTFFMIMSFVFGLPMKENGKKIYGGIA